MKKLPQHSSLQRIAKEVLAEIGSAISPSDSERTLADHAVSLLQARGVHETWYYNCPAYVLAGSRSCLSISGRDYVPSDEAIGEFNLVTVDLSPLRYGLWGDCARSFCIENGKCTHSPAAPEFQRGLELENLLHQGMREFVSPSTTFEELHTFANEQIRSRGFENLDFAGNLGHSIVSRLTDRIYIEAGNTTPLAEVEFFTFEPHIREVGGSWGFKLENIYYFDQQGSIQEL